MYPDVAVVVVTHNSAELVNGLLESIPAAVGDHSYEVVVVDNESTDDTVNVVSGREDVKLLLRPNLGYSAGINAGAAAVPDSEAILALNPDVRLAPGSISHMMHRLRSTGCGIVAPKTLDGQGNVSLNLRREPTLLRATGLSFLGPATSEYVREAVEYAHPHTASWAVGAVLLVSRECHEELGGWDESFFLYSEETDFCLRAGDAGWNTFFEPAALVTHTGGGSGRSGQTHSMQILNRVRIYARRHRRPAAWLYYGLSIMSETSWLLRGNDESRDSLRALIKPGQRPAQLRLSSTLLPR